MDSLNGEVAASELLAAGICRAGDWANKFLYGLDTQSFVAATDQLLRENGLRLASMSTWIEDGERRWASIHRSGNWAHRLVVGMNTTEFLETTERLLHRESLRLERMVTWDEDGSRRWAGSYRSGNWEHRLVVGMDTHEFLSTTQELLDESGLRLENMVAYRVNGKRRWAGVYRSGDWENRLLVGLDSKTFLKETQRLLDQNGLRLVDTETYCDNGTRLWAGISRSGDWTSRFIMGDTVEAFAADTQTLLDKKGLRLINLDVYDD